MVGAESGQRGGEVGGQITARDEVHVGHEDIVRRGHLNRDVAEEVDGVERLRRREEGQDGVEETEGRRLGEGEEERFG